MYSFEFFVLTCLQKMCCYEIYWFLDFRVFCGIISKQLLLKIQNAEFQQYFFCRCSFTKHEINAIKIFNKSTCNFIFSEKQYKKNINVRNHQAHFSQNAGDTVGFFLLYVRMCLRQWLIVYFLSSALLLRQTSSGNHYLLLPKWSINLCHFRDIDSVFSLWNCIVSISPLEKYIYFIADAFFGVHHCLHITFYVSNKFLAVVFSYASPNSTFFSLF